jgi:anaerobic magnesium-protoporphyrin IX monomethyl ester cyclase
VLVLVPMPPPEAYLLDPHSRSTLGVPAMRLLAAGLELENFVKRDLGFSQALTPHQSISSRSLTAVALATALQDAGLRWAIVDPGCRRILEWKYTLAQYTHRLVACIAISTTYFVAPQWLEELINLARASFPKAKIVVGGYMYGTSVESFLSLSADVICVGEGEERLPQVVRAVRGFGQLDKIGGLYIRHSTDQLIYTGPAPTLDFLSLRRPDWRLASKINPAIDASFTPLQVGLETQRGCLFKCRFCTFRTLTPISAIAVSHAVNAICELNWLAPGSTIALTDPTATFPRDRWRSILTALIESGGAPHPIFAYARVSDVDRETAALMARANVRSLFIGQESGDQRVISAMRKGTSLSHVRPCVEALAAEGIFATFGFIHGFPGEDADSMQATRAMICSLNSGFENEVPVMQYQLSPFFMQDLASIKGNQSELVNLVSFTKMTEEIYATFIASSRVCHAPCMLGVGHNYLDHVDLGNGLIAKREAFHIAKLIQRGVAYFLEKALQGRPSVEDISKIRCRVRDVIPESRKLTRRTGFYRMAAASVATRLSSEFGYESELGVGFITRLLIIVLHFELSGRLGDLLRFVFRPDKIRARMEDTRGHAVTLARNARDAPRLHVLNSRRLRSGAGNMHYRVK